MGTKDGLTAWEVIWLLFPESEYGSNQSALALWPGGVAWIDDKYYNKNSGEIVWPGSVMLLFLDLLREGLWYATGRLVPVDPSKGREHLQLDLWDILGIDLDDNTASGGGLEYVGLRFYETKPKAKKTKRAETQCREWLIELMKAERKTTMSQILEEANEKIPGLSDNAFGRAWKFAKDQPTTHKSWQSRGPIKSL